MCACLSCRIGIDDVPPESTLIREIQNLSENDDGVVSDVLVFVEENSYVALYSSTQFELFYIFYVRRKCVADEAISDVFGHIVQAGESYFEGHYLENTGETKIKSRSVYMHPSI